MKIIDKYILKRYLSNFFVMLIMFIPIGIIIDVSEKVDKMIEYKIPFSAIAMYYCNFTVYYSNFSLDNLAKMGRIYTESI